MWEICYFIHWKRLHFINCSCLCHKIFTLWFLLTLFVSCQVTRSADMFAEKTDYLKSCCFFRKNFLLSSSCIYWHTWCLSSNLHNNTNSTNCCIILFYGKTKDILQASLQVPLQVRIRNFHWKRGSDPEVVCNLCLALKIML